ncbi:MAG: MFS transporter, partial [bacterium]
MRATWALLVGIGFMMLGNGLQGTLLGLRATIEGFPTFTTGVMMSGYFVGIFIGSVLAPRLVGRVGHIRVFAALASTASISILLHVVYVHPLTWTVMRLITGISYAGLYVVTESWLNDRAGNESRGKLLSIYMVIVTLGLGVGQFGLNLADPKDADLFILVSVVVSFGLIPMLLTARPAPAFEISGKMSLPQLFRASPLAVISNALTGVAHGTIFGLGAVYAAQKGFDTELISIFMACFLFGGLLFQWPLGLLSDRIDRRAIMAAMAGLAVALTALAVLL